MGKNSAKHELILLFDQLELEPKKLYEWLQERGQDYSYHTIRKYYYYWASAKLVAQSIMKSKSILKVENKK